MDFFRHVIKESVFFISLFLVSCGIQETNYQKIIEGTPVTIGYPKISDINEYITLNANTIFIKKEIVKASFQGFIEKVYKNIGDKITEGDLLFELRTKDFIGDKNSYLNVNDSLFKGLIQLRSKSNGVLTELIFNTGEFVSEGEQVAVISNPSSLRINLNVPYQYTDKLNLNTSCEIILPNGKTVTAVIQKIIPQVDPNTQTQSYILAMLKPEYLPENLNVSAQIPISIAKNSMVLPQSAILSNETLDQFWIMKLLNDSTAIRVDIEKGIENNNYVQIVKPQLNTSDKIIFDGGFGLADTSKIIIKN
jgi:multidrug efflux pump subunit AcrA (membrane-fusion protein)